MARSVEQILREMLGACEFQIAVLIADNEALREKVKELESGSRNSAEG